MSQVQEDSIIARCIQLDIDTVGLRSIRQFVEVALYHARMPDITLADQHVALNSNLRFATNRIACQGRHGHGVANCRMLSPSALALRDSIAADQSIAARAKFGTWSQQVTEEHQDPVAAVGEDIVASLKTITVDEIVSRLLRDPSVIVTKIENGEIPGGLKHRGAPSERYSAMGEPILVDEGTAAFFDRYAGRVRRPRPSKYYVERKPWLVA